MWQAMKIVICANYFQGLSQYLIKANYANYNMYEISNKDFSN